MKTAWKALVGLMLILAAPGCCCLNDRTQQNWCATRPDAPVATALAAPEVTLQ